MQQPRNRQEFMRMQQQAVAAAKDMQKRNRFREQETWGKEQRQPPGKSGRESENLHHNVPQFRNQGTRQRGDGFHHNVPKGPIFQEYRPQFKNPGQAGRQQPPNRSQRPSFHNQGRRRQNQAPPPHRKQQAFHAPPPSPPPPPAPGLADLFAMFGNMGGKAGKSADCSHSREPSNEGGMDSILVILLMFLLQKEGADQGLMMALMYIMM